MKLKYKSSMGMIMYIEVKEVQVNHVGIRYRTKHGNGLTRLDFDGLDYMELDGEVIYKEMQGGVL